MTKIWVTSDNHFFHKNIIKYCNRPFNSVEDMNEYMIKRWNKKVRKRDIVLHLGDFAFKHQDREVRRRLNGTIILIMGNHDYKSMKHNGFIVIDKILRIGNLLFSHSPLPIEKIPKGFINVHGHIHHKKSYSGINVSVENTDYEPVELDSLLKRKV